MSEDEKIELVKVMTGGSYKDNEISSYLKIAGQKIINRAYPYDDTRTDVPTKYALLQCEIAVYLLNKIGAEGQTSHKENGIDRVYEDGDVPSSMLKEIVPYCGVIR